MHLFNRLGPFAPDENVSGRRLRIPLVHYLPARGLSSLVVLGQGLRLLHWAATVAFYYWELEIDILVIYGFAVWGWWQKERGSERDGSVLVLCWVGKRVQDRGRGALRRVCFVLELG